MKFVPVSVSRFVASQALKTQQASPTLLFAGGIVGMVGTVVLASKATLRLEEVLEESQAKLADVNKLQHDAYSDQDRVHDKAVIYTDAAIKVTKLYGPAIVLGVASVGMLAGSHRILTKRNAALSAAYTALEKGFKQYRQRVIDDLGEEKDREFYYGTQTVETVDPETGKKSKQKVKGDGALPPYAKIFDETNPNWQGIPDLDRVFLEAQQRYATDKLRANGHLFLNDVYKALGMEPTEAGQIVGWWLGAEDNDGYVDFGFGNWPATADYIHARTFGVVLDFNVDGPIAQKLKKR